MSERKALGNFSQVEIAKLKNADILFIQAPLLVWNIPAMLKLYLENVFIANELFQLHEPWSEDNFKIDQWMTGKKVMISLTAGSSHNMTASVAGSIDLLFNPIKSMFEFVGYEWLTPYITYSTTKNFSSTGQAIPCNEYFVNLTQHLTNNFPN
jgi:putative NADPH-quinone reductase